MHYDFSAHTDVFKHLPDGAIAQAAAYINAHARIFVYGAGRSGLMMKAFAMRLAQAGRTVFVVGETVTPAITRADLLILASASGTTASVCRYAKLASELGAQIFSIVASENSPLATLSDHVLCLPAPSKDDAPAANSIMGTLFEQSLLLCCDLIVQKLGTDAAEMRARHANLE